MQDNKELQVWYIVYSINKENKIESIIIDTKLSINDKVKLIELHKLLKKVKSNGRSDSYTITDNSGRSFTIITAEGSV
jgi:hypothetical protein